MEFQDSSFWIKKIQAIYDVTDWSRDRNIGAFVYQIYSLKHKLQYATLINSLYIKGTLHERL